jgi:acetyl-CoA carboxylase biotin carboxyl carrier protein
VKKKLKTFPKAEKPMSPELKRLEEVFRMMGSYGVGEVDIEDKNGRVHVRMAGMGAAHAVPQYSISAPVQAPQAPSPASSLAPSKDTANLKTSLPSNQKQIPSPFVGTFYRSSNPNSEPYAKEGQRVKKGQTLCIIEAMKLMNEIESDFDGKIVTVLVENGQPVEFGEPLFVIEI